MTNEVVEATTNAACTAQSVADKLTSTMGKQAAEGHGEVLYFKYDITVFHVSITRVWRKKYVGRPLFFPSDCESKSRRVEKSKSQRVKESSRQRDCETTRQRDCETARLRDFETTRLRDNETSRQRDFETTRLRDNETARRQVEKSKSRKVKEWPKGVKMKGKLRIKN